jgi:hypothetical protein
MVELQPDAGVAGSTPASDAVSCPIASRSRAPALPTGRTLAFREQLNWQSNSQHSSSELHLPAELWIILNQFL